MDKKAQAPDQDRAELLEKIKADFDARLAKMAADPAEWVCFIETVATFGAQYSLNNQFLLLMQAEERDMIPAFFLPFGNKAGTSGWKKHQRSVRKGEKAFHVWAPVRRRPAEQEARRWEAEGRTVKRDEHGRPVQQVVGFRLSPTFDISQTDGAPFEVPSIERVRRQKVIGGVPARLLTGQDPTGAYDDVVKLINGEGYEFELAPPSSPHLGSANGVTVKTPGRQLVRVRDDVDGAQRVKTSVHDLLTAPTPWKPGL